MIAIWIGIFFFTQAVVLVFTLVLGKSAALADREFERARTADQRPWFNSPDWIDDTKELINPVTKSTTCYGYSSSDFQLIGSLIITITHSKSIQ